VACLTAMLDDVRPDTVLTFGPDGFTGHPDHRSVGAWTDAAARRSRTSPRVLHAVAEEHPVDPELDEDFGVFDLGRPRVCTSDEMAVQLRLTGAALDRKVAALLRQESQTSGLVAAVGRERFRAWVATESFASPRQTG
jgi:LmbE family N-acetylglucosaminyl deacetylase